MTDTDQSTENTLSESTITERLEARNATLDTLALIQDLDREGFDFEPYVLPDTADDGKMVIDTFREYGDGLDADQLAELERRIAAERDRRDGDAAEEVTA